MSNTKREMLSAYNALLKRLEEKREAEAKPEEKVKEKRTQEAIAVADALSTEGISKEIASLKAEIGKVLAQLSDKMEEALEKYVRTTRAVDAKERELAEIYEIEKSASTLAALIEAQREKREQFEANMQERKEELEYEIETTRQGWKEEQQAHAAEIKEREEADKKKLQRDLEEFKYKIEREKQLLQEDFEFQKAKLEREAQFTREERERDLVAREKAIAEREAEHERLREEASGFPEKIEAAVKAAVDETKARLKAEANTQEALMRKEFEGDRKVLQSQIESLQRTVEEQSEQIARLTSQLEKSYGQVQDIAVKAIEGSSNVKSVLTAQAQAAEQQGRESREREDK